MRPAPQRLAARPAYGRESGIKGGTTCTRLDVHTVCMGAAISSTLSSHGGSTPRGAREQSIRIHDDEGERRKGQTTTPEIRAPGRDVEGGAHDDVAGAELEGEPRLRGSACPQAPLAHIPPAGAGYRSGANETECARADRLTWWHAPEFGRARTYFERLAK
jgi:hypothetical protein